MKLCEIYDEGCSSLSFDYTCKIRDGTELEMETQSDTRHNLKTTPTPTPTVSLHQVPLHCEKLPPPCHLFITKKKIIVYKLICDNVYSKKAKKKTINTFL